MRGAGRRVPRDVSVVGFDGVHCATDLCPSLTTLRVPYGSCRTGRRRSRRAITESVRAAG
ncbi:substrate-binding domain-containing protein [Streptomyces niveiscabiei]|uniref:substrate-binding domain-containing protein n=1 Tax=Streptomyces niveiscabiei TaxID=164115 RepID=UPI0029AC5B69|nr:substrate-binding domain-containing protein [Streptomyces niveiscabiei]MDX3385294.1 substrate-binding domain-containing protein [Streptomyces niveiscabiei]